MEHTYIGQGSLFVTDNGNYVVVDSPHNHPERFLLVSKYYSVLASYTPGQLKKLKVGDYLYNGTNESHSRIRAIKKMNSITWKREELQ